MNSRPKAQTWKVLGLFLASLAMVSSPVQGNRHKNSKKHVEGSLSKKAVKHFQRAGQYLDQKRFDNAIREYREALKLEPGEAYWHSALAGALEQKGDHEEALAELHVARQLAPDDPDLTLPEKSSPGEPTAGYPAATDLAERSTAEAAVYVPGKHVTSPVPIYKPDPSYSERARYAKYSAIVVLWIVVDPHGVVTDIRVLQPAGLGLDEIAIKTVRTWKFKPGMRDGVPVAVRVTVSISFHIR